MSKPTTRTSSSGTEKPLCQRPRRLADWLNPDGQRKVHSLVDKVYQPKNLRAAWEKVKANRGSGGVDGQSLGEFEQGLEGHLRRLHEELRGMATEVAGALQRSGQVARTVTTKLRYADFSIRSRSTSLATGIDAPETIGDLACQQLDRGLRDRPGALRLVGVGVSGLADFRQLALDAV